MHAEGNITGSIVKKLHIWGSPAWIVQNAMFCKCLGESYIFCSSRYVWKRVETVSCFWVGKDQMIWFFDIKEVPSPISRKMLYLLRVKKIGEQIFTLLAGYQWCYNYRWMLLKICINYIYTWSYENRVGKPKLFV